ncbi:MAG: cell division protein FtsI/penicillin-binding protein 2 [bacterium]|nr:MAG: cell division protein FtsI/penicillin-binding protein 2 [bacterium]
MKSRFSIFFLALLMAFSTILITNDDVYASSRSKAKASKSKKPSVARGKGKPASNKYQARYKGRGGLRTRSIAYKRSVTRLTSVNNVLLSSTRSYIEQDDLSGEDLELRGAAVRVLGEHPATVVIMDPNTGRVHTIVNQKWAVGKPVKPCSTIKLITSIAALNEGLADPNYTTTIPGGGSINMINALAYSNNEYFQLLGQHLGFDQMINYARDWGLGSRTGINIDGESPGFLPDYKSPQALPRMCSHGDDIGVTALQLAVLTSAIANGGKIYQPQILRTEAEKQNFKPVLLRKTILTQEDREKLIEGMLGAVNYGTARRSGAAPLNVAGKTGSCNGEESKLGLFASFSSPDNPEMVVVVVSTGSGEKGSVSADVAGQIYNQIAHRLGKTKQARPFESNVEPSQRPRRVNPIDSTSIPIQDDDDDE